MIPLWRPWGDPGWIYGSEGVSWRERPTPGLPGLINKHPPPLPKLTVAGVFSKRPWVQAQSPLYETRARCQYLPLSLSP